MTDIALGVTGYPGSGKSVVSNIAEDIGFEIIVMGDHIRKRTKEDWSERLLLARESKSEETPSEVYGKFATEMRSKHGQGIVAKWCKDEIQSTDKPVLIDGMRSPEELYSFREYIPVELLFIHAPASMRYKWIKNRNRDKEENFTIDSFIERDKRENGWGLNDLIQKSNFTIHNCVDEETFVTNVEEFLENFYLEYSSV